MICNEKLETVHFCLWYGHPEIVGSYMKCTGHFSPFLWPSWTLMNKNVSPSFAEGSHKNNFHEKYNSQLKKTRSMKLLMLGNLRGKAIHALKTVAFKLHPSSEKLLWRSVCTVDGKLFIQRPFNQTEENTLGFSTTSLVFLYTPLQMNRSWTQGGLFQNQELSHTKKNRNVKKCSKSSVHSGSVH